MEIKTITYSRNKNLGNYQSEKIEITAYLDEYDNPDEVTRELKERVYKALGLSSLPVNGSNDSSKEAVF